MIQIYTENTPVMMMAFRGVWLMTGHILIDFF